MKSLGLKPIAVGAIGFGDRLRPVDEPHAQLLAENIAQVGRLRSPIEVRLVKPKKGQLVAYTLIAGGHRLRAAQILGWEEIEAFVFEGSDDEIRLYEIDENLVRHELNPLDRAVFLAERKAIYLRMHPETAAGVAGGKARQGAASDIMSFAAATALKCGWTERTIERAVFIHSRLAPDVRVRIAGTKLAKTQSELLALAKATHAEQRAILEMLLAEQPQARSVEAARKALGGGRDSATPDADAKLSKLLRAWRDAPMATRRAFLRLKAEAGEIDALLGNESGADSEKEAA